MLYPVADSFVDSLSPTSNYNAVTYLYVSFSPRVYTAYLKFDLGLYSGKVLTNATLTFTRSGSGSSETFSVKQVSDTTWLESGVGGINYNNRPALGPAEASFAGNLTSPFTVSATTAYVSSKLGGLISFGIDSANATSLLSVYSREYVTVSSRPKLTITYNN